MDRADRGLSLIEITVAFGIIVIALLGIMSALIQAMRTDEATAEQVRAMNACRSIIEQMKQAPFAEIYARFNNAAADDPGGAGTAPGKNFAVQGLRTRAGDADGQPGEIFFPESGGNLCETVVDTRLGMPRDLNGDPDALDINVSTTYIILPVRIVIDWQGARGPAHFEMSTFLNP